MDSLEPKKLALIRILQILERDSDCEHPLKHDEIVKKLDREYGIVIERKAIGRNISLLKEAGFEVETTKKSSYLASRLFEDSELRLLSDSILSSRHITAKHSKELIDKIASLSNKYFKSHIKNVYSVNDWGKSENVALFYNIEMIDEAIEKKRKIKFEYNKYGVTRPVIQKYLFDLVDEGKHRTAEKLLQILCCIFDLAVEDLNIVSPMKKIVLPYHERIRISR